MSRRKFVVSLALLGGALSVLPAVADADDSAAPSGAVYWAKIGPAKDFPVNALTFGSYPPEFGRGGVYVKRVDDKTASALSAKCVHRGCRVAFQPSENVFRCPCHHAQYSAAGEHLSGPGHGNLAVLLAKIEGGDVWVQSLTPPRSAG
ncbi:MAG: Rieske (2Fe-2S) protein [Capsulimonadaceae bacterium]|nr:Rieske (2Fe-2S) protein [Capsulimonadaceae bacterium]